MVFYRKYRPQKIEELDSAEIRETLYSVFSKNTYPHAFLFTGPKGLGKTSTARIVAKIINCEKHRDIKGKKTEKEIEPCNHCDQCTSISNGNNFDILEIDGASNRGIDEIRDLREKIKLSPSRALKKVYIIDEVHMLTTEAFNALLKTLEEPPSHAIFILCTTEPNKVPGTIVSRCFHINFTKATQEEFVRSLTRVSKAEDLKTEKDALVEIAKLADGSFRDGVKILEEVSLISNGKTITKDLVDEKFKLLGIEGYILEMLDRLSEKDRKKAFELLEKMQKQGVDARFFIEKLMENLHESLLGKIGVLEDKAKHKLTLPEIKRMLEMLSKAHMDSRYSLLSQMPLEFFIIEWTEEVPVAEVVSEKESNSDPVPAKVPVKADGEEKIFKDLIEETKKHNVSVAGVLHSCSLKSYDGKSFIIETKYKFHKERLEEQKAKKVLQDSLKELTGKELEVSVILS